MKTKLTTLLPGVAVALVVGVAVVAVAPQRAHVAAKSDTTKSQPKKSDSSKKTTDQQPKKSTKSSATPANYTYVAQPGDSYTLFARKAIETYAQQQKINLSQNRIIYAETNLTIAAGSPYLNVGEQESLSGATVKSWVTNAVNLSDAQAALWDVYVPAVNFDVSGVGQAS